MQNKSKCRPRSWNPAARSPRRQTLLASITKSRNPQSSHSRWIRIRRGCSCATAQLAPTTQGSLRTNYPPTNYPSTIQTTYIYPYSSTSLGATTPPIPSPTTTSTFQIVNPTTFSAGKGYRPVHLGVPAVGCGEQETLRIYMDRALRAPT